MHAVLCHVLLCRIINVTSVYAVISSLVRVSFVAMLMTLHVAPVCEMGVPESQKNERTGNTICAIPYSSEIPANPETKAKWAVFLTYYKYGSMK